MPLSTFNLEWLNHNSIRAYPIFQDATQVSLDGSFTIPQDFIVGMYLSIPALQDVGPAGFYISQIGVYSTGFSVTISYQPDNADPPVVVASAQIARAAHTQNQTYTLNGTGDFDTSKGTIVIGTFDGIDKQPSGVFSFDLSGAQLETDVIRPMIRGITGITVVDGNQESQLLQGVIRLRAGTNMRFTLLSADDATKVVRLDAIAGENLNAPCVCTTSTTPIKTINGVGPDDSGNLNLLGNSCLTTTNGVNSIQLADICSSPCCTCTELEKLTQSLEVFGSKAASLEGFLVGLEARVSQMDMVVLGSRLNDRGCS